MERRSTQFWRYLLLLLYLTGIHLHASDTSSEGRVLMIKSADNSYYQKTLQVLKQQHGSLQFQSLTLDQLQRNPDPVNQARLIITFGIKAASFALKQNWDIPKIHAYITKLQFDNIVSEYSNSTAVLLNQPLERHFRLIHAIFPEKSIGLINYKARRLDPVDLQTLQQFNLTLNQYQVEPDANPLSALRQLVRENQVLLAHADTRIYNRSTLKGILLTAYRRQVPMISYSPAHVKAGALASIYSSPEDIGRHISGLITPKLNQSTVEPPKHQYARYFSLATNKKVAQALGIQLPENSRIIDFIHKRIDQKD